MMALTNEDKVDIQELCACYAQATDSADIESWLSTWMDDGELIAGFGSAKGKEQLRELEKRLSAGFSKGKRHVIANIVVRGDSEKATATSYLIVFEREKAPGVVATAVYSDTLEKVSGQWKFARRELHNDSN